MVVYNDLLLVRFLQIPVETVTKLDTMSQQQQQEHDMITNEMKRVGNIPSTVDDMVVRNEEVTRAVLKEQALQVPGSSSMRDTMTGTLGDGVERKRIDPYLLKLLSAEDASKISKGSANKSKQSGSTDFKVPEPPKPLVDKKSGPELKEAAAIGVQASNSLEKPKEDAKHWDFVDTQNVLGEDTTDILRRSVIQNQREFLEQIYDLHRALAVQKLLVRHCNDQKLLMHEYRKEEGRAKKARKKAGLGFGTTTSFHKGLHPDSQFAAVSHDSGTDEDVSGDDLPGSGDDVAASGSGGNGKSGNGSGGGSTSHLNAAGTSPGLQKGNGNGMQAPSGASNAPMLSWPPGFMGPIPPGGQQGWSQQHGMGPALIDVPNPGLLYGQAYGTDPMMLWYQDYFNRISGSVPDSRNEKASTLPAAFKWWKDPKLAFGTPGDAKHVLKSQRREGVEVESAPPHEGSPEEQPASKAAAGNPVKRKDLSDRLVSPAPKKRSRHRKRLPEDPVDEASSGTSGPAHHLDSSDGGIARSPRSRDANVAKLLLSFSGKSLDPVEQKDGQRDSKRGAKK